MSVEDCKGFDEVKATFQELSQQTPILEHDEKATVDDVLALLKEQKGITAAGTKTLFLKSKKGELVLVTALREVPTDLKVIQGFTNMKDLRFANSEVLHDNLKVVQGCVTPFPLINNLDKRNVTVLFDESITRSPISMAFCMCRNDRTIVVTFEQLKMYMDKIAYPYRMVDFSTGTASSPASSPNTKAEKTKQHTDPAPKKAAAAPAAAASGETKLGIAVRREDNFSAWYIDVITKAEMIEYYDVSGCYIIRPWAFYVWKCVQRFLGDRIERMGVEDCYFPMFVSRNCLEREKEHIEGFAPEVAWVTRAGDTDLEQPVAVRPTSETVMYPYYAKWIRSHRDLPVRLNMWNNVIRWEFSHPTPFIRTREFLWQEGHCAWAKAEDCAKEVLDILECYAAVYEQLLAVPVVRGRKTDKEKFAGGYYTTTVETYVEAVGRGCQGATSHNLGQNFGKMFDIKFQDPENNEQTLIPWQNSWGLSTRVIGVMIMVHGDNRGMVMPPRVASTQVVIIPVGITKDTTEAAREALLGSCRRLEGELCGSGVRAKCDLRDNYSPGWRFNHWEVKGVPLRVELGPKELAESKLALTVRCSGEKRSIAWDAQTPAAVAALLEDIQAQMYSRAKETMEAHRVQLTEWSAFVPALNRKCVILAPWCGSMECEDQVKKDSAEESKAAQAQDAREDARAPSMGAKTLCIPFAQPGPVEGHTCICKSCTKPATTWVLFGRSY
ncbi:putative mitochondrial prolyl-tRNA synthetase, putative,bifunctional aminoacyl-tRNA synthetase [Leptomonas pyrrhocoris]|uniref:proline--tRNA ligase n=1 Tax=Leptomonas pyrrhocoris TaxID=157538 RepID=A0A0M9FYA6_LEPPY|nr:putative mitochondrial prolyl-tRNA synthetase, putative,bifunctional aminoacyl-tRNA synthetase [Leptomonas pyrrhocoris]KPA78610.1 putative mitochondrial prolyl-tRNA synthetase, putative,bifunctional aminoacyl-tRNA synthetase [Leptomonas pyrrhocoris]|eukprot:XP_015657049.1 putative mitochondrial prolyl-tRNA synthetase, putative,bifunctional aminoacyl-tRNA synthetase [Leptomonas pyrrhocoris]